MGGAVDYTLDAFGVRRQSRLSAAFEIESAFLIISMLVYIEGKQRWFRSTF